MYSLKRQNKEKDQQGAVAVIVVVSLTALIGIGALAVDLGYLYVVRNELQNVADGAALAATRQLGSVYEPMTYAEQQSYVCSGSDKTAIVQAAVDVGAQNYAGGQGVVVDPVDIEIGRWNSSLAPSFTNSMNQPDAVRVTVRKDGGSNAPAVTFLAKIFGIESVDISADATAALTGIGNVGEGELDIPVGISRKWFEKPEFCNQPIKFYPTGTLEGCAGWTTFDYKNANAEQLEKILNGMEDGTYESPEATAGDTSFQFTGGNVASRFEDMKSLYDSKKDADGKWETTVLVYDYDDCSNPKGDIEIVGFATAIITGVEESPSHTIDATVVCENAEWGRGSGGNYGTKGTIPGLVE